MPRRASGQVVTLLLVPAWLTQTACQSPTPSVRIQTALSLPVPSFTEPDAEIPPAGDSEITGPLKLSARALIRMAFDRQPDIKASFHAFKAEEARYDFFYASNDALTPRLQAFNTFHESRTTDEDLRDRVTTRDRQHTVQAGVDKQFFDTTRVGIATGIESSAVEDDVGNQPFVSANVRYPLWGSRERLERTSEDIFRRNELSDAQLDYIKQVRHRLEQALSRFYEVVELRARAGAAERWHRDLRALADRLDSITNRDVTADRSRIQAEVTRVGADLRNFTGRCEIETARLKYDCGLPYETALDIDEEPFNPFAGVTHAELRKVSLQTDPEIATLRNAMRNAEVQLDLARHGRVDVALLLDATSRLRRHGAEAGNSDWSLSAGIEVSAIDARVTGSLLRQAQANIQRFKQAITARESLLYADTLEPLVRIETLTTSRDELIQTLPRYQKDYEAGLTEFLEGRLIIDDLLARRENVFDQDDRIAQLGNDIGANVAELCSATGKFFELLGNGASEGTEMAGIGASAGIAGR